MKIKKTETFIYEIDKDIFNDFFQDLENPDPIEILTTTDKWELQEYLEDPFVSGIKLIKTEETIENL